MILTLRMQLFVGIKIAKPVHQNLEDERLATIPSDNLHKG
ncbi:hypothetical protein KO116_02459 [Halomonas sp. KO116]|nr:hypothetical protein KO116_02459 [Halomonas sp. KO116]